jgi:MFS family permease
MAARYGVRIWLALVTVYLVWGSTFIALAIVIRDLPPFLAMSVRHLVAGAVLLAVALPHGDRGGDRIGRRQLVAAFIFGGLLFVAGDGSLAWAQQTVAAGVAALLVGGWRRQRRSSSRRAAASISPADSKAMFRESALERTYPRRTSLESDTSCRASSPRHPDACLAAGRIWPSSS